MRENKKKFNNIYIQNSLQRLEHLTHHKINFLSHSYLALLIILLLNIIGGGNCQNSQGSTIFDGVSQDQLISYYTLDNTNGIIFPLSIRQQNNNLDYYMRIWIRLNSSYDLSDGTTSEQVFEFPGSLRCSFIYNSTLTCQSINNQQTTSALGIAQQKNQQISMNVSGLEANTWVCMTVGGQYLSNLTYVRLDYQDRQFRGVNGSYLGLFQIQNTWNLTVGRNSSAITQTALNSKGFKGDFREIYIETNFQNYSQGGLLSNQIFTWDDNTLADYRLQRGNLNSSILGNSSGIPQNLSTTQPIPTWSYDYSTNDMCYAFFNQATVIKLNGSQSSIINGTIDQRMSINQTNYQYTVSFWLKTLPGIQTNQTFNSSLTILSLQGVFSLWFTDQNNIRLMVHSTTSSLERQTGDNFIPTNQWANVQFIIDKSASHLEIRVYDLQRRLLSINSYTYNLGPQSPTRNFTLFQNYFGYFKSLSVYQSRQTLPLVNPVGVSANLNDSSLIIYYKFDIDNYSNMALKALNINSQNSTGSSLIFTATPQFETIQWEENLSYSTRTTLATTSQNVNLFDGIACNDQKLIYTFSQPTSYLGYDLNLTADMTKGTVEFWFRRQNINQSQPIQFISLFSSSQTQEYLSIYQDANETHLRCKPKNDALIVNGSITGMNQTWIHFVCKFKSLFDVTSLYKIQNGSYNSQSQDFNTDMTIPMGTYSIYIGNNYLLNKVALNTQIKEVRLWSIYRLDYDITQTRYSQLGQRMETTTLLLYSRLASGDPYPQNLVGLQKPNNLIGLQLIAQTDNLIEVCPLNTFYSSSNQTCMRNPFINQTILLLPYLFNNSTGTLNVNYSLTSNYSSLYQTTNNPSLFQDFTFLWTSFNPLITISSATNTKETIQIGQNFINFASNQSNGVVLLNQKVRGVYNTFSQQSNVTVQLQNCSIAIDTVTNSSWVQKYINVTQGSQDINLTLTNLKYQDCGKNRTVVLMNNISITIFPQTLGISNITYVFNSTTQNFTVTIPKAQQILFPTEQDVNLIIMVGYNITDNSNGSKSSYGYQNLVYTIKFTTNIYPIIKLSQATPNILLGETIRLYANDSYQVVNQTYNQSSGLSYIWSCPAILQNLCASKQGNRYLDINYNETQKYQIKFDTQYTFSLTVWKSIHEDTNFNQSTSVTIMWVNKLRPQFVIIPYNNTIFQIQQDNYLNISLKNYDLEENQIQFDWTITPSIDSSYLKFTTTKSSLVISKSSLLYNSQYKVVVKATLISYLDANSNQTFNFTTGSPFSSTGFATISPSSITTVTTQVTLSISGYVSTNQNITFNAFGISNQSLFPNYQILLNPTPIMQGSTFTTQFAKFQKVLFEIINSDEQYVQAVIDTSSINQIDATSLDSQINNIIADQTINQTLRLMRLRIAAYEIYQNDQSQSGQSLTNKAVIIQSISAYASQLSSANNDLTNDIVLRIDLTMQILMYLTDQNSPLDDSTITNSLTAIQGLRYMSQAFNYLFNQSGVFAKRYAQTLSNMQSYVKNNKQSLTVNADSTRRNMRVLQTNYQLTTYSSIQVFLTEIQNQFDFIANSYCQDIKTNKYEIKSSIQADTTNYAIERIPAYQFVNNRSFVSQSGDSIVSLPYYLLIAGDNQTSPNAITDICYQVQFSYFNNLMTYNFTNQTIQTAKPIIQIKSMNNYGNDYIQSLTGSILLNSGTSNNNTSTQNTAQPWNIFNITYQYLFNDTSLNFRNNQTVCLALQSNQASYTNQRWSDQVCSTVYDKTNSFIYCYCNKLGPNYYSIGTDLSRIYVPDDLSLFQQLLNILLQFDTSIIAILFILIWMLIVMPFVAICQDRKDYDNLKQGNFEISEQLLRQIAYQKNKPYESVVYNKARFDKWMKVSSLSFCQLYGIFINEMHPLFSVITRFDIELKRLIRLMFILFQIALVSIICGIVFGTTYRVSDQDDPSRDDGCDSQDVSNALIAGCCLALICFPTMNCFLGIFRTRIEYESNEQLTQNSSRKNKNGDSESDHEGKNNKNSKNKTKPEFQTPSRNRTQEDVDAINDIDDGAKTQHTQSRFKADSSHKNDRSFAYREENSISQIDISKIQKNKDHNQNDKVVLRDSSICCKLFMLLLCFLWTVLAMLTISLESGANPKAHSQTMVIAFFFAILLGFLVYDFILIAIIALATPSIVREEIEYEGELGCCSRLVNALIIPYQAKELMKDLLLVYELNNLYQSKQLQQQQQKQNKNSNTLTAPHSEIQSPNTRDQTPIKQQPNQLKQQKQQNFGEGSGQFRMPNQKYQSKQINYQKDSNQNSEPDDGLSEDYEQEYQKNQKYNQKQNYNNHNTSYQDPDMSLAVSGPRDYEEDSRRPIDISNSRNYQQNIQKGKQKQQFKTKERYEEDDE